MTELEHEEHLNWVAAMKKLEACGVDVNAIPRELFVPFEGALREWAVSYVRAALEVRG